MIDYRIYPKEGYSRRIGELIAMLEHTRTLTVCEVEELSPTEVDFLTDEAANSVGALLLHMAAIETVHQVITFENRDFNEREYVKWQAALELGEKGRSEIKGKPIQYYLDELAKVREKTLAQLAEKNDEWLLKENSWPNGTIHNNYYLWYHVMEDEINHRGQIRVIKRLLSRS